MLSTRGVPPQPTPAFPSYMKVRVDENLVTANVRTTPLQQVLQEIADRTGLVFEVQSQDDPPISINLFRVRIQEAVERIVASDNSIFYYGKDASQQSRIEFVRVFPRINQPQQPSLIYIGTGAITKSGNDTVDSPEDALKVLTDSQNLEARQKAVEVLVAAKGELATLALTAALLDPAPEVRVAAIEGLASLGAHSALPGIIQSLKDKHPGVRQSAITAVALMGDSESIKELKPLSKDRDVSVAAAAEEAIRTLSSARRP
ncbi:MAG TPA: HEAT repeat domain-containing protein [Acidobacteriota bacterium]|nr:HEAT repeat domain-containing protein [Acidobacteriota bacterium]